MGRISRLIAPFALLGTAACAADGPLAPQLAPEPEPARQQASTAVADTASAPAIELLCVRTIRTDRPEPLYVVDGRVMPGNALEAVDPNSIEHIEVIKGAAAVALYGERASIGAVIIRTRAGS